LIRRRGICSEVAFFRSVKESQKKREGKINKRVADPPRNKRPLRVLEVLARRRREEGNDLMGDWTGRIFPAGKSPEQGAPKGNDGWRKSIMLDRRGRKGVLKRRKRYRRRTLP